MFNNDLKMKTIFKNNILFSLTIISLLITMEMTSRAQQVNDWIAPKYADTLKNPLADNLDATMKGKITYMKFCVPCHGDKGKGDGVAGVNLNPQPHDLTLPMIQKQTDGVIFWKITNGKPPMVSYKKILTDEQRWQLVNYIRQLGKPKTKK